jgi:hypothetical protein
MGAQGSAGGWRIGINHRRRQAGWPKEISMKRTAGWLLSLVMTASCCGGNAAAAIEAVVAHPVFSTIYSCTEHAYGELKGLGDELGLDCHIEKLVETNGRRWLRAYRTDGLKNGDWYGWGADVLAPCTGQVEQIRVNEITNEPGIMGKPPASWIAFNCGNDLHFLLAHIAAPVVKLGEHVDAGQKVAQVGNNGMSRQPHIHIGAWRGKTALQIRFDQAKIAIE